MKHVKKFQPLTLGCTTLQQIAKNDLLKLNLAPRSLKRLPCLGLVLELFARISKQIFLKVPSPM